MAAGYFYEYAVELCRLAAGPALDDAAINHLFWFGDNDHCPLDLPVTTGLSWREGIFQCLGSVRPRARTSPSSVALPTPPPAGQACRRPQPPQAHHQSRSSNARRRSQSSRTQARCQPLGSVMLCLRPLESTLPECPLDFDLQKKMLCGGLPAMAHRVPGSATGPGMGAALEVSSPVSVSFEASREDTSYSKMHIKLTALSQIE